MRDAAPPAADAGYRPEIDGLRAVAVLPVILYHAGVPWLPGGFAGVDVFFVISGYLITRIVLAERAAGTFSLAGFYERRARRILPALFVMLAASLPFGWALLMPGEFADMARSVLAAAGFAANLLFWSESGYFAPEAGLVPHLHTWSLAVEEQFYLLYPALLLGLWRFGPRGIAAALGALALLSLGFATWASVHAPDAAFYLLPARVWELAAGALAALALARRPGIGQGRAAGALAALGLALIGASFLLLDAGSGVPGPAALLPVIGAVLVVLCGAQGPAARFLRLRWMVGIGLVSYSAYLWHHPVLAFARHWWLGEPPPLALAGLVALSLGLAWASWRFVERPFRDRARVSRRGIVRAGLSGALALGATGGAVVWAAGFPERVSPEIRAAERALETLRRERLAAIGLGRCQFAGRDREGFLARWDCTGPGPELPTLAVVGDSHAADTAAALRLAGHSVMQMTGQGCALAPALMSPDCARIFSDLRARLAAAGARPAILLANRWGPEELTPDALAEAVAFWRPVAAEVVVLTTRPVWPAYARKAVRGGPPWGDDGLARSCWAMDRRFARLSEGAEAGAALAAAGARRILAAELMEEIADGCGPWSADGAALLVDDGHLSPAGAAAYGRALAVRLGLGPGAGAPMPPGPPR